MACLNFIVNIRRHSVKPKIHPRCQCKTWQIRWIEQTLPFYNQNQNIKLKHNGFSFGTGAEVIRFHQNAGTLRMKTKKSLKRFGNSCFGQNRALLEEDLLKEPRKDFWIRVNGSKEIDQKQKKTFFPQLFWKGSGPRKKVRSENRFISFFCVKSEIFDGFRQKIDQKAFLNPIPRT